jgi:hypothetical protein
MMSCQYRIASPFSPPTRKAAAAPMRADMMSKAEHWLDNMDLDSPVDSIGIYS